MLKLSIDAINQHSPYSLRLSEEGSFCFTTDEALVYEVGFIEDYMLAIEKAYQFFLLPKGSPNITKDDKMQQTVTAIIEEFFQSNDVLLDYICDTKDGRQAARSRLFTRWFSQYPNRQKFTLRTIEIEFESTAYYASAILRNDNPNYSECMEAINEFEKMMREKLR